MHHSFKSGDLVQLSDYGRRWAALREFALPIEVIGPIKWDSRAHPIIDVRDFNGRRGRFEERRFVPYVHPERAANGPDAHAAREHIVALIDPTGAARPSAHPVRHGSLHDASREAHRLSEKYDAPFGVYALVGIAQTTEETRTVKVTGFRTL